MAHSADEPHWLLTIGLIILSLVALKLMRTSHTHAPYTEHEAAAQPAQRECTQAELEHQDAAEATYKR